MAVFLRGLSRADLPCGRTGGLVSFLGPSLSNSSSNSSSGGICSSSRSSSSFKQAPSPYASLLVACSYLRFCLHARQSGGPLGAPQPRRSPQTLEGLRGRTGCWQQLTTPSSSSSSRGSIRCYSSSSSSSSNYVVRVPPLGDSITEGTVLKWLHAEGSVVHAEEALCVLETDKVAVDVAAKTTGKLVRIAAPAGTNVVVGGELAVIEPLDADAAAAAAAAADAAAAPAAAAAAPGAAESAAAASPTVQRRRPSILFRSVRNRLERLGLLPHQQQQPEQQQQQGKPQGATSSSRSQQQHGAAAAATPSTSSGPGGVTVIRYTGMEQLPPSLQPRALSPEEINIINDGGLANADTAVRAWTVSLCFNPASAAAAAAAAAGGSSKRAKKGASS
ncbi:dihydrolipoamide acyltransferase, putative [Eimeria mitis]|uniref:Dihydrolipoamide acyltransferase, putative n=1 Tax=Eimeria mitis TaxID=44415 RepID=U6KHT8_9EIME|nr:dihydrolipoamide acyltransferase, putative [Eimeria mitis]CDJ36336.1 dihydrolipoamide acyltransferase, putative [Eimeria mitis]